MVTLELAGKTIRMNVAFPMVEVLLRRQLLENDSIRKKFQHEEIHY